MVWPLTRIWLMHSSMMTPVWTETPKSARKPTPEETLKWVPVNEQREQAAERGDGDVGEDEHGPLEGAEHGVEDDEDEQDGERADDHAGGASCASGARTRRPSRCW